MNITKKITENTLVMTLAGRLDTSTAPVLEKEIQVSARGITDLVLDFADLEYVSSAGLRVILIAQKCMSKQGSMTIKNVNDVVKEIFDITGFADILTIE